MGLISALYRAQEMTFKVTHDGDLIRVQRNIEQLSENKNATDRILKNHWVLVLVSQVRV